MMLAFTAGCVGISFGGGLPGQVWLFRAVPLLRTERVPSRFGHVALAGMALLAGFGLAARWGGRRWWRAAAAALVILVNGEALRAPMFFPAAYEGIPAFYDVLRAKRRAVVVEPRLPERWSIFDNARPMYNSTRHWHPLLNGYSGDAPASFSRHLETARSFPDEASLAGLHAAGVTHVIVRATSLRGLVDGEARLAAVQQVRQLEPMASDGELTVYRLRER